MEVQFVTNSIVSKQIKNLISSYFGHKSAFRRKPVMDFRFCYQKNPVENISQDKNGLKLKLDLFAYHKNTHSNMTPCFKELFQNM